MLHEEHLMQASMLLKNKNLSMSHNGYKKICNNCLFKSLQIEITFEEERTFASN